MILHFWKPAITVGKHRAHLLLQPPAFGAPSQGAHLGTTGRSPMCYLTPIYTRIPTTLHPHCLSSQSLGFYRPGAAASMPQEPCEPPDTAPLLPHSSIPPPPPQLPSGRHNSPPSNPAPLGATRQSYPSTPPPPAYQRPPPFPLLRPAGESPPLSPPAANGGAGGKRGSSGACEGSGCRPPPSLTASPLHRRSPALGRLRAAPGGAAERRPSAGGSRWVAAGRAGGASRSGAEPPACPVRCPRCGREAAVGTRLWGGGRLWGCCPLVWAPEATPAGFLPPLRSSACHRG